MPSQADKGICLRSVGPCVYEILSVYLPWLLNILGLGLILLAAWPRPNHFDHRINFPIAVAFAVFGVASYLRDSVKYFAPQARVSTFDLVTECSWEYLPRSSHSVMLLLDLLSDVFFLPMVCWLPMAVGVVPTAVGITLFFASGAILMVTSVLICKVDTQALSGWVAEDDEDASRKCTPSSVLTVLWCIGRTPCKCLLLASIGCVNERMRFIDAPCRGKDNVIGISLALLLVGISGLAESLVIQYKLLIPRKDAFLPLASCPRVDPLCAATQRLTRTTVLCLIMADSSMPFLLISQIAILLHAVLAWAVCRPTSSENSTRLWQLSVLQLGLTVPICGVLFELCPGHIAVTVSALFQLAFVVLIIAVYVRKFGLQLFEGEFFENLSL